MSDLKIIRKECQDFAKQHLKECCAELLEWQNTAILRDGRIRELASMCRKFVGDHDGLRVAESFVNRAAVERIANGSGRETPPAGHCSEGDRCVCGGDLPKIREGCGNWVKGKAT